MNLQILLGRHRTHVYTVEEGTFVVGRGADCDVVLASDLVSRRHASITVGQADVSVTDLKSANGTFINGARLVGSSVAIQGDVILIGDVALRLHRGAVPALEASATLDPGPRGEGGPVATPFEGTLHEIPPSTLFRYLAVLKKSGTLTFSPPPALGTIELTRGQIREVLIDGRKVPDPVQSLTGMMRWRSKFVLQAGQEVGSSSLIDLDAVLPSVGTASRI
jgi:hypothetical protein